jgi:hypothetical protein
MIYTEFHASELLLRGAYNNAFVWSRITQWVFVDVCDESDAGNI